LIVEKNRIASSPFRSWVFLAGPATVFRYGLTLFRGAADHHLSQDTLGGWSVVATLLLFSVQAGTGLFTHYDISTEGPLKKMIGKPHR
jgi:cytochrome b